MIMTKTKKAAEAGQFAAEQFKTVFGDVNERAKAADREFGEDRRGVRRPDPRQCRGDRRLFEGRRQGRRDAEPGRGRV